MPNRLKETIRPAIAVICCLPLLLSAAFAATPKDNTPEAAQSIPTANGFYPLEQVHRGLIATAYTVFEGTKPEPMQVEILGLLKNALGPNMDMILARLQGNKPEYTGVVAGMSGSPVYVDGKLLGALSYRIGVFSKEPIAGITPIAQMLQVQEGTEVQSGAKPAEALPMDMHPIDTPLVMSGFRSEAIKLWQDKFSGTSLQTVSALGGVGGQSDKVSNEPVVPGSSVSALIIRGDLEIAATCTVTYVDPKQLLACGHPITQFGPISMPMTKAEVVATLASPLNAFKIVNTTQEVGAFTDDRHSAIHGVFGQKAEMIPVTLSLHGLKSTRNLHFDIMDHPQITVTALLVAIYQSLLENNGGGTNSSYRLKAQFDMDGFAPVNTEALVAPSDLMPSNLDTAMTIAERFSRLYTNPTRLNKVKKIQVDIQEFGERKQMQLDSARVTEATVHPGDNVTVEATLRPYQGAPKNVRLSFTLPASLAPGSVRLLISDGATLDRILQPQRPGSHPLDLSGAVAQLETTHATDRLYATLLFPSTQAGWEGRTLASLPLSMANVLEPLRNAQDLVLNSESGFPVTSIPVDAVLVGQQVIVLQVR